MPSSAEQVIYTLPHNGNYIGQTVQGKDKRCKQHSKNGKNISAAQVVMVCTNKEELDEKEAFMIGARDTYGKKKPNLTRGNNRTAYDFGQANSMQAGLNAIKKFK